MRKRKRIYTSISFDIIEIQGKPVTLTRHALIQCIERGITFPEQLIVVLHTGKIKRYGKHGIKFIGKDIILVGIEENQEIKIKTVVRK